MRRPVPGSWLTTALGALALLAACEGRRAPEPPPVASPPWGEAVGGLALGLDAPRASWTSGEPMVLTVRARNGGTAPLLLARFADHMWWHHVRLESLDGGPTWLGGAGLHIDYETSPDASLAPGASWTEPAELNLHGRRFLRLLEDRKPGDDWDYRTALPAGRYRAVVEYAHDGGSAADGRPYWAGRVRSNPVEIVAR